MKLSSNELRRLFLNFFEERGHRIVLSSSLVPYDDPTLLFTNAGMNQFKKIFLGQEKRDYKRAASCQKCLRVSGKHNDLEEVGKDGTHHTFFEMLGNWSFGDYYKKEAIEFAWEFLTKTLSIPKEKLWVTVYMDDSEAEKWWKKIALFSEERILRFDESENFWEMGETGPCGPCSEIHYDRGEEYACGPRCSVNCKCGRFIEVWNLVFIQFERDSHGNLSLLPEKHVDTGMGFERMISIVQGVDSDYKTDLFLPVIRHLEELSGKEWKEKEFLNSFRAISDHIRALVFCIGDGVIPSNEGRGYVVRRILRRATRQGMLLGLCTPFLYLLSSDVIDIMKDAYFELSSKREEIAGIIKSEEERFLETLKVGTELFEESSVRILREGGKVLPGDVAFRLHDTYGFPLDLTCVMAEEKGLSVDIDGFEKEMAMQRERARRASKFEIGEGREEEWVILRKEISEKEKFCGYDVLEIDTEIVQYRVAGEMIEIVLDCTPFYPEGGGQVGDNGEIIHPDFSVEVINTLRKDDKIVHIGKPDSKFNLSRIKDSLDTSGIEVKVRVKKDKRQATALNHTTTHLLHSALRKILGMHVHQEGSLVEPLRLRFDFTHFKAIEAEEKKRVEFLVNQKIRENIRLVFEMMTLREAKEMGAMALFGEKYEDSVRVVRIGDFSLELCGGTHVKTTGEIGLFKIISEENIASGIRRIEAVTGEVAFMIMKEYEETLLSLSELLKVPYREVFGKVEKILIENRDLKKRNEMNILGKMESQIKKIAEDNKLIDGVKVASGKVECSDEEMLRRGGDILRENLRSGVGVLGTIYGGQAYLNVVVTNDLVSQGTSAAEIINKIAVSIGGKGGGREHMALAGVKNIENLDYALKEEVYKVVKEYIGSKK